MSTLVGRVSLAATVSLVFAGVVLAIVWGSGSVLGQEGEPEELLECELAPALSVSAVRPDGKRLPQVSVGDVVTYRFAFSHGDPTVDGEDTCDFEVGTITIVFPDGRSESITSPSDPLEKFPTVTNTDTFRPHFSEAQYQYIVNPADASVNPDDASEYRLTPNFTYSVEATSTGETASATLIDILPMLRPSVLVQMTPGFQQVIVGGAAKFGVIVTNTGGYNLSDITVRVPEAVCTPNFGDGLDNLMVRSSRPYSCQMTVVDDVSVRATVTATAIGRNPELRFETESNISVVDAVNVGVMITKSPVLQAIGIEGLARFDIEVKNTGEVELIDLVVSDPLAADCAMEITRLSVGASFPYTCTEDPDAGFTNFASVEGKASIDPTFLARATSGPAEVQLVDLRITKEPAGKEVAVGERAEFLITVENRSGVLLTEVTVSDENAPLCGRPIGDLAPGVFPPYNCFVEVKASLDNRATVTATTPTGHKLTVTSDTAKVSAVDISVVLSPDMRYVYRSDARFTATVANPGSVALEDVQVVGEDGLNCDKKLVELPIGGTERFTCTAPRVDAVVTAVATGKTIGGVKVSDSDSAVVDAIIPKIEIIKTPHTLLVSNNSDLGFTITVTNKGDSLLRDIAVPDLVAPSCAGTRPSLEVDDPWIYDCEQHVISGDSDEFRNTARVEAISLSGDVVRDVHTVVVKIIKPDTKIDIAPANSFDVRFLLNTLVITETNTGNVDLVDPFVTIGPEGRILTKSSTEFVGGDTDDDSVLDVGETWEWRLFDLAIRADGITVLDGSAGAVRYSATGHGTDPLGADVTFPAYVDERDRLQIPFAPISGDNRLTRNVFAELIARDNLLRLWHFDNGTQTWSFFAPRPAFAAANTLHYVPPGSIVWVNVSRDQEFQSQSLFAGWNLFAVS